LTIIYRTSKIDTFLLATANKHLIYLKIEDSKFMKFVFKEYLYIINIYGKI